MLQILRQLLWRTSYMYKLECWLRIVKRTILLRLFSVCCLLIFIDTVSEKMASSGNCQFQELWVGVGSFSTVQKTFTIIFKQLIIIRYLWHLLFNWSSKSYPSLTRNLSVSRLNKVTFFSASVALCVLPLCTNWEGKLAVLSSLLFFQYICYY